MKTSQNQKILKYLKSGKSLTALKALQLFGCFRLASRMSDLKSMGVRFKVRMIETKEGKHIAEYRTV